jgi:hypothetical protein
LFATQQALAKPALLFFKKRDAEVFRRPDADRDIVCSPPPQYRLSVSTCAAKVRASLLKARFALSCCGILTAARFFDPGKKKPTGRPIFLFCRNRKPIRRQF